MTNSQMTDHRWAKASEMIANIQAAFAAGHDVYLVTYLKNTRYQPKHAPMFRATKSGAYVQRGEGWDCIDGVAVVIR